MEIKRLKLFGKKILINLIVFYILLGMCMFMALELDMGVLINRIVYVGLVLFGLFMIFGCVRIGMEFSVGSTKFAVGNIEEIREVRSSVLGRVKWYELIIKSFDGKVKLRCLALKKSEIEALKDDNKTRLWKYTNSSKTLYHIKDI